MDAQPRAFITGISGQDGSYLAELLLSKGYEVHGLVRRLGESYPSRLKHLEGRLHLHGGDIFDITTIAALLLELQPDEIYHLAAQSVVSQSWQQPLLTADVTAMGTLRLLEAVRIACPQVRYYQSSSSEMFGKVAVSPQNESTPFQPRNLYGVSKVFAHQAAVNYREHYGLYACCGILYNHESPRRGLDFVTRKVTHGVAQIKMGLSDVLRLGCLTAVRDWGFAGDYVEAMWRMLQQATPQDFVIGTGVLHSVENLVEAAFDAVGLHWKHWVETDASLVRPPEEVPLCADAHKARQLLGWKPRVNFCTLIGMMVEHDMALCRQQAPAILSLPARRLAKSA
ncbi:MAG TPA: GDP-mannose 4,6-dehydratase [Gemmatales bacterium]|nr:GDP-mannose 4,6-dehydratase [Gemmatales bacterium]